MEEAVKHAAERGAVRVGLLDILEPPARERVGRELSGEEAVATDEREQVTHERVLERVGLSEAGARERLDLLGDKADKELEVVDVAVDALGSARDLLVRVPLCGPRQNVLSPSYWLVKRL